MIEAARAPYRIEVDAIPGGCDTVFSITVSSADILKQFDGAAWER